jgi:ubiquinone/menaquinone biosynthesis C-methylase UbiE
MMRDFFETLAGEWDALQSPERGERLRQMLAELGALLGDARNILEVGTGTGALLPFLHECAPSARLVAVDFAHAMLARAQTRGVAVRFAQADVHTLPFRAVSFDVVICHGSFPHFRDKRAALFELKRVLQERGHLFILHDVSRIRVNAAHQGAHSTAIHHDLLPCSEEMCALLSAAGFGDIHVEDTSEHYLARAAV